MTQSQGDASASPKPNPLFTPPADPLEQGVPPGMRSIYERMTKPTTDDLAVGERLRALGRTELDRVITHFGMAMEHLAAQRNDIKVSRTSDATSWTVHIEMVPQIASPVQVGN